ncbi:unnamed protein product, partial [Musa acuminata var. zebrina]
GDPAVRPRLLSPHALPAATHAQDRWVTHPPSSLPSSSSASASPNPFGPHRLLSLRPNTLALPSRSSAAASIIRISSFSAASVPGEGRDPRISDEWGGEARARGRSAVGT